MNLVCVPTSFLSQCRLCLWRNSLKWRRLYLGQIIMIFTEQGMVCVFVSASSWCLCDESIESALGKPETERKYVCVTIICSERNSGRIIGADMKIKKTYIFDHQKSHDGCKLSKTNKKANQTTTAITTTTTTATAIITTTTTTTTRNEQKQTKKEQINTTPFHNPLPHPP